MNDILLGCIRQSIAEAKPVYTLVADILDENGKKLSTEILKTFDSKDVAIKVQKLLGEIYQGVELTNGMLIKKNDTFMRVRVEEK